MFKKMSVIVLFILIGCNSTPTPLSSGNQYSPTNQEQFVFITKKEGVRKYGYENFCPDTSTAVCYKNVLSYDKYHDMKGYFTTTKPILKKQGFSFWPVTLENGESYYYVTTNDRFDKSFEIARYGDVGDISDTAESIVEGSDVKIVGYKKHDTAPKYILSNGKELSEKQLDMLKELLKKLNNNAELLPLLSEMVITKDTFEGNYIISARGENLSSPYKIRAVVNGVSNKVSFYYEIRYFGDNWIFAERYTMAIDSFKTDTVVASFNRDNFGRNVFEQTISPMNSESWDLALKVSNSTSSAIRFYGKRNSDKILSEIDKKDISKMIELHNLLNLMN